MLDNREPKSSIVEAIEGAPNIQDVHVGQGLILPPYEVTVTAKAATLRLRIRTKQKDTDGRFKDMQRAISHITHLASENELVTLDDISVGQVASSYDRSASYGSEASTGSIQNLDTSSITVKLTATMAADHDYALLESIIMFNEFLKAVDLPEAVSIQALSVETELGDLETYRGQLISQVYEELESVQNEYGQSVKYEVTGLYNSLKMIQLSDTEYYIYLEPIIMVREF